MFWSRPSQEGGREASSLEKRRGEEKREKTLGGVMDGYGFHFFLIFSLILFAEPIADFFVGLL